MSTKILLHDSVNERILQWLRGSSLKLLILAGVILLIWNTLIIGTIVWWLSQEAENLGFKKDSTNSYNLAKTQMSISTASCYIIFLTGVGFPPMN